MMDTSLDTSPELEAKYRAMVLARFGEERLRMAGSMYAAARALVLASVRETDPSAAAAALREAVFLRFYGHEFEEPTRERIRARLRADAERETSSTSTEPGGAATHERHARHPGVATELRAPGRAAERGLGAT
jgi:hypothetical protein